MDGGGDLTHSVKDLLVFTAANIAVGVNYSDSSGNTPSPWAQGGIMDFLFGADMPLAVRFFFAFVIVLALIGADRLPGAPIRRASAWARPRRAAASPASR